MSLLFRRSLSIAAAVLLAAGTARAGGEYTQTNLVSDISGMALHTDPNLQDPWGIALSASGPFWVSDQADSLASIYSVSGTTGTTTVVPLAPSVPNLNGAPASPPPAEVNGPTGQVSTAAAGITTSASDFNFTSGGSTGKAVFIFANLDGSISAWKSPSTPAAVVASVNGASYTGLAIGNSKNGPEIYAADQNSGRIDVFDKGFNHVGSFTDPNDATLAALGYRAFNVQNLTVNGVQTLFVTYANQATSGGVVDEFTTDGQFIKTLVSDTAGDHMAAPWGVAIAPKGWGVFGGDLLVANNNGPGQINAYNLQTGAFAGSVTIDVGGPASTPADLWGITFGNGGSGGSADTLYFTAGLASNGDGLFGALSVPEPSSAVSGLIGMVLIAARWTWKKRRRASREPVRESIPKNR